MTESRLQRWSRKKSEARSELRSQAATAPEPELSAEEQELAINEALPEQEVLEKYNLPDPDAIQLGTDITGFMRKEIPELLRRRALRSLWRSNPVLAVLDGLNDYDEDYTGINAPAGAIRTLYKVGEGLIDKTKQADQFVSQLSIEGESQHSAAERALPSGDQHQKAVDEITQSQERSAQREALSRTGDGAVPTQDANQPVDDARVPRYRPRMRFDS